MIEIRLEDAVPRVTSSLDVEKVLTEIVTEAVSLLKAETGDIILKEPERGVFRIVAAARHAQGIVGAEYPLDQGLAAQVLSSGRTIIVPDYASYDHRIETLEDLGFRALMSSPLIARGETIGVLTVEHTAPDATFDDDDARLLTAFANHAAVALDNARRYENEVALSRELARANEELSRSLGLQRRLVDQVLADSGPGAVAAELARMLDSPVVLQDRFLHVIAGATPDGSEEWRELVLPPGAVDDLADRRSTYLPAGDGPARLVAPVIAGDEEVAAFVVVRWAGEPSGLDLALIEVAATGVALELLKISARAQVEHTVRGDLAVDLVTGAYSSPEVIAARAARMGYDLSVPRDVILLQIDADAELAEHDVVRLKRRAFEAVAADVPAASIVAAVDDRVLILAAGERDPGELAARLVRRLRTLFGDLTFSVAVGTRCASAAEYGTGYHLARRGLEAAVKLGRRGQVVDARELGIHQLVVEATEHEALRAHVAATLAPLTERGPRGRELLETLEAYVASGFNQRETARRSFVHINTVANRLERIGRDLGRDLNDPETLVDLALALRLARLLDLL